MRYKREAYVSDEPALPQGPVCGCCQAPVHVQKLKGTREMDATFTCDCPREPDFLSGARDRCLLCCRCATHCRCKRTAVPPPVGLDKTPLFVQYSDG